MENVFFQPSAILHSTSVTGNTQGRLALPDKRYVTDQAFSFSGGFFIA